MKANSCLSAVLCPLSCLIACLVSLARTSQAAPSWALVNTAAYGKDSSPSTAKAESSYSAYLCTVESVKTMFGGDGSVASVTSYLSDNYTAGLESLATGGMALKTGEYDLGQYTFANYNLSSSLLGDYLAVIAYANGDDKAIRVFSNTAVSGNVVFDDESGTGGGTAGAWTSASVPEPTSGLLLLLGVAGLALKRKNACSMCGKQFCAVRTSRRIKKLASLRI